MTRRKRVALSVHGLVKAKWLMSLGKKQGIPDDTKTEPRRRGVDIEILAHVLLGGEAPTQVVRYRLLNDCRHVSRLDFLSATKLIVLCSDPSGIPYDILQ